jgi:class 3 adenylate cyclase
MIRKIPMALTLFSNIWKLAVDRCATARHVADNVIQLSENVQNPRRYAKSRSIADLPGVTQLEIGYGMKAWAAVLSVDMVESSNRAVRIGARNTYITMHTYMPVMAEIASVNGYVVGLRGDGLFAAYGLTKLVGTGNEVTPVVASNAVRNAARTGKAMMEAVQEIINPILESIGIEGDIQVRVGIDIGDIVVTRIGIDDAQELTTYGPSVNKACKMGIHGQVTISHRSRTVWSGKKGGRVTFHRSGSDWRLNFDGMRMLKR